MDAMSLSKLFKWPERSEVYRREEERVYGRQRNVEVKVKVKVKVRKKTEKERGMVQMHFTDLSRAMWLKERKEKQACKEEEEWDLWAQMEGKGHSLEENMGRRGWKRIK